MGSIRRRSFAHAARAALAALVATAGLASGRPARAETPTLYLATWSNYVSDKVIKEFEAANGCKVQEDTYTSNAELLAKLAGNGGGSAYDVAVPSDMVIPALIAQGLLERLDRSKLPNLAHLDPAFLGRESDPKNEYS